MRSIAIFGGTFDPVHNGHVQASLTIQSKFHFNDYFFVPCKSPTLKEASMATSQQRVDMLKLALNPHKEFTIDLREMKRKTPSYMIETLQSYRQEFPEASITLIIGYDAFLTLPQWHQWDQLIKLANLLVINRESFANENLSDEIEQLVREHQSDQKSDLLNSTAGNMMFFNAGNYDISSTYLRQAIKLGQDVSQLLPKEIVQYIKQSGLFQ